MRFGPYDVVGHLGSGGMSLVWLARGPDPAGSGRDRFVVLKRQINPVEDERLREEARVGMKLKHPAVVQTLELIEHEGRPMLVLEYVDGASLAALRKLGPLPAAAVCRLGGDIADALAALHTAKDDNGKPLKVLHRDVSPANIIVSADGRARLIDLGIARTVDSVELTNTGNLRGTLRYLAPELFEGKKHTPSTDLWALGVVLFEAALGRPAATGAEAVILASIVRGSILDLHPGETIEPQLLSIIKRLCAPEGMRLANAAGAASLLVGAERGLGDGRKEAGAAVRALPVGTVPTTPPPGMPRKPAAAADGDDGFLRAARNTYCGQDDEELFGDVPHSPADGSRPISSEQLPPTAVVGAPTEPIDAAPTAVLGPPIAPQPITALAAPDASSLHAQPTLLVPAPVTAVLQAPPTTPGSTPAGRDSWNLPQPITGEDAIDAAKAKAAIAGGPAGAAALATEPYAPAPRPGAIAGSTTDPAVGAALSSTTDPSGTVEDGLLPTRPIDVRGADLGVPLSGSGVPGSASMTGLFGPPTTAPTANDHPASSAGTDGDGFEDIRGSALGAPALLLVVCIAVAAVVAALVYLR